MFTLETGHDSGRTSYVFGGITYYDRTTKTKPTLNNSVIRGCFVFVLSKNIIIVRKLREFLTFRLKRKRDNVKVPNNDADDNSNIHLGR